MVAAALNVVGGNRVPEKNPAAPIPGLFDRPPTPPWPELPRIALIRPAPARADMPRKCLPLDRAVAQDVVPRLVAGRRGTASQPAAILPAAIEAFSALVLGNDFPSILAYAARARGPATNLEALYLELLAPTARNLGAMWDNDQVEFTRVTIGLGRLHQVMREFSLALQGHLAPPHPERRALLVAAPGEQHTFGLAMVTEFFRRAAWSVWSGAPAPGNDLTTLVRENWFGIVGFSLGSEARLDALRKCIAQLRRASQNPRIGIMVGGPVFIEHPEFVAQVGADAMAIDGRQAVMQAQNLLANLAVHA